MKIGRRASLLRGGEHETKALLEAEEIRLAADDEIEQSIVGIQNSIRAMAQEAGNVETARGEPLRQAVAMSGGGHDDSRIAGANSANDEIAQHAEKKVIV
jgi:hypothetical protein